MCQEVEHFLGYLPVEIVTVRNQQARYEFSARLHGSREDPKPIFVEVCLPAFSSMNFTTEKNGVLAELHETYKYYHLAYI